MDTLEKIPWYRTRWFWGGALSLIPVWIVVLFTIDATYATGSFLNAFDTLVFGTGGSLLTLYGYKFSGAGGGLVSGLIYLSLFLFLTLKTFLKKEVRIFYPLIIIVLVILGNILGWMYLGGL